MSSEWLLKTVGEFCPFKYGKGLPERDRRPGKFGVYSSAGLVGSHDVAFVKSSGVVIGRKGTVGSVTYSAAPFWPIDTSFYVDDHPETRDIRYTYYLLKTLGLHLMNTDSAVPGLNRENAHAVEVLVPPLGIQKNVATFLEQIDDRITLLRETNATLEAIAQALFKSWFVDFDPVRAKAEGLEPLAMDAPTAALFPDSFEESELGLVPKGWQVGALSDCCERVESGGTPKRTAPEYWSGEVPWLTSGEVRNPIVLSTKEQITELGVSQSSAKIWPKGTTVVAMYGATAGEVCLLANPSTANQACCGLIPMVYSRAFTFICARRERAALASKSSGSAQQNLNKGLVSNHPVLIPSKSVFSLYEEIAGGALDGWIANEQQAQTLTQLRDTLLPRLISGQLRLPEAESMVEEAV